MKIEEMKPPTFKVEAWEDDEYVVTMDGTPLGQTRHKAEANDIAKWLPTAWRELLRRLNAGEPLPNCGGAHTPAPHAPECYQRAAGEPGPRCPKCSAKMKPLFRRVSIESKSAVKVECQGNSADELAFHEFTLYSVADFAKFFPAERREELGTCNLNSNPHQKACGCIDWIAI